MTAAQLRLRINAADLAGFTHYAQALRSLYQRQYGFSVVTGADFARSIAWARQQPAAPLSNEALRRHVREHKQRVSSVPQQSALIPHPSR